MVLNPILGLSFHNLYIYLILFSLLVAYVIFYRLNHLFVKQVRSLSRWSKSLAESEHQTVIAIGAGQTTENLQTTSLPKLTFQELDQIAQRFRDTVGSLNERLEKEKQFLRSLSHELRTPLSVISLSLELMDNRRDALPDDVIKKIERIRNANASMCDSSETLLWLWSDDIGRSIPEQVDVERLLAQVISASEHLKRFKEGRVSLVVHNRESSFLLERHLFEIVARNLVKNAFQYAGEGDICIEFGDNSLTISNPLPAMAPVHVATSEFQESGFGVGLFLVEFICQTKDWPYSVKTTEHEFSVSVSFVSQID